MDYGKSSNNVTKTVKDKALIKALISFSENDLKFLDGVKLDEFSARKYMSNYYDVLRSLLEAIAISEGYKIYSYEAFTEYLIQKNEVLIAKKFDRFRKIRNGINYYGKNISIETAEENVREIKKLIKILKNKYLKNYI